LLFIVVGKYRKKPTKEMLGQMSKIFEQMGKEGTKFMSQYWTLGRYDFVSIVEGKDEKTVMKSILRTGDIVSTESLVAVPREEAIKLVE
jgi:uncharacterized protein with GYD domain